MKTNTCLTIEGKAFGFIYSSAYRNTFDIADPALSQPHGGAAENQRDSVSALTEFIIWWQDTHDRQISYCITDSMVQVR